MILPFVQEVKIRITRIIKRCNNSKQDTEVFFGKFTDDILSNYWISSSNDHPTTVNSSVLSRKKIDYDGGAVVLNN